MKLYIKIFVIFLFSLTFLTGCNKKPEIIDNKIQVSFVDIDGTLLKEEFIEKNSLVTPPTHPLREGFEFVCWTYNNVEYDFSQVVTQDIILIAKWKEIDTHYSNGLEYSLDDISNTLSVIGIGTCIDTDLVIPNSINGIAVTSIQEEAFSYCSNLKSIYIPSSIISIGSIAFGGCSGLDTIVVDSNNQVYDSRNNCNAIIETKTNKLIQGCKNTNIPDSITTIGGYSFYGCEGLENIIIPNSVTTIEFYAFYMCTNLKGNIYDNAMYLGNNENPYLVLLKAVNEEITDFKINENTKFILDSAFQNCDNLKNIVIPRNIVSIGRHAFSSCNSLESVQIPNTLLYLGSRAFTETRAYIYCETEFEPSGWEDEWNYYGGYEYWNGEWEYDLNGNPCPLK